MPVVYVWERVSQQRGRRAYSKALSERLARLQIRSTQWALHLLQGDWGNPLPRPPWPPLRVSVGA